ncbi:MAG: hypothetical protein Q9218_004494 [Villophora microphyllina]
MEGNSKDKSEPVLNFMEDYYLLHAAMSNCWPFETMLKDSELDNDWRFQHPASEADMKALDSALRFPIALFTLEIGIDAPQTDRSTNYANQWTILMDQFFDLWKPAPSSPFYSGFGVLRRGNGKTIQEWQDGNVHNLKYENLDKIENQAERAWEQWYEGQVTGSAWREACAKEAEARDKARQSDEEDSDDDDDWNDGRLGNSAEYNRFINAIIPPFVHETNSTRGWRHTTMQGS